MSRFFIDRPVFAWVVALLIMLVGVLSLFRLPINQYPDIAAPSVQISVTYPGASAQTVQDTVVQVIEQQLNGLDGLRYLSSNGNSDGSMTITVTFDQGTNPDIAQVQVQNKLQLATPNLPQEVQQQGIRVTKSATSFLIVIGLVSTDGRLARGDLADFVVSTLQDPISRTYGVGDFQVFGTQYSMRIWLDPVKLNNFKLTPVDVSNAIKAQNVQISSGQLGGMPAVEGQQITATIIGKTRLQTPEQFNNILLKVNTDGSQVRLRDVATAELSSQQADIQSYYNGMPTSGIGIKLATGANALDTANAVRETLNRLKPLLPEGVEIVYPYDTTPVIRESIMTVVHTLFEAVVLVFLVMFLFLQNLRATLVPTLAVPVVLLGTFAVLNLFGYSINTLSMFAMVLAIGLLVDDAIVVVENVERLMAEEGLSPLEATRKSMDQIQGALVGIGLVLSAVFLPMAFFGGSSGIIFRQFSVTIATAMILSVLMALIFTPTLCVSLLKPSMVAHHEKRGFFGWFNRVFDSGIRGYERSVGAILRRKTPYLLVYLVIVVGMGWLFSRVPSAFLPDEDQGLLFVQVQAPVGSSGERTAATMDKIREYMMENEKDVVSSIFTVTGFNFAGRGQNSGLAFISLRPWAERTRDEDTVFALMQRAQRFFSTQIRDAKAFAFAPPAVIALGNASGFDVFLEDRANLGHEALVAARNQVLGMAAQSPVLAAVRPNGMSDEPQFKLEVDDEKARALGVSLTDINSTVSAAWGYSYVNDFIDRGRVKKVFMQGVPEYRMSPESLKDWYVRNANGDMVPFNAFASGHWIYGAPRLERYNGVPAVEIMGQSAPGYASGEAMAAMEGIMAQLPAAITHAWTGVSFEERSSGNLAPLLYALSLIVVFLCLAALYESWAIPFAVMLAVPLGIIGAVVATLARGLANDVFFQVGLLTTVGLTAKNAILIVEFAKELHEQGKSLFDAAVEASRMRLRPIIMTSMAFTLGVVPLAITTSAGAGSAHAVGTGVIGGMLSATFLAIFWVPLFFVLVLSMKERKQNNAVQASQEGGAR